MSTFTDTFASPVTRKVGDVQYVLPQLNTEDYIAWCEEERDRLRAEAKARIPKEATKAERQRMMAVADDLDATPDMLARHVLNAKGTVRVLRMAAKLAKPDATDADLSAFLRAADHRQNTRDAVRASGLFSPAQYAFHCPGTAPSYVERLMDAVEFGSEADVDAVAAECRGFVADRREREAKAEREADKGIDPNGEGPNG